MALMEEAFRLTELTELESDRADRHAVPNLELLPGGAADPVREIEAAEFAQLLGAERAVGDLEAAVALVHDGLAGRIVLTGFPSWPGLLWHAYELAAANNVLILPAVARTGGLVDIVITREPEANG
jgi:hypothetical protein